MNTVTPCINCGSTRFMNVFARCGDDCSITLDGSTVDGDIPSNVNIGGHGDAVGFDICANCGRVPGKWPLNQKAHLETVEVTSTKCGEIKQEAFINCLQTPKDTIVESKETIFDDSDESMSEEHDPNNSYDSSDSGSGGFSEINWAYPLARYATCKAI